jgi:regulator of sirC expression with transglutaminase-like and TPR domain
MTAKLETCLSLLGREPAAPIDLAELALLLARDEFPFLDVEAHLNELAGMAHEAKPYLKGHLAHQVQGLCRYLFHEMGFRGNQRDYYDPRNSYLNCVLERRAGIPITLAVVMIAVGQRAGLQIAGIGLPGHFIVKAIGENQEVLIDPFHGGRILSAEECEILVQQATGLPFEASPESLAPLPIGLIVQRMLNNLKMIYFKQEDWRRAVRVLERLLLLRPEDIVLRRDVGMALVQNDQPGKAIDHLRNYLDLAAEAEDRENVRKLLRTAIKKIAEWN